MDEIPSYFIKKIEMLSIKVKDLPRKIINEAENKCNELSNKKRKEIKQIKTLSLKVHLFTICFLFELFEKEILSILDHLKDI